jgi:ArsR family transcriptional regulator, cadmium/lead-responsive transcriptional repressor
MEGMELEQAVELASKARLFHGLAEPSRLAILEALRDGPLHVGELVARTGLTQSNTSNHLACLLGCGLVSREPQGRRVIYALSDRRVEAILHSADVLVEQVALQMLTCTGGGDGAAAPAGARNVRS